MMDDWATFNVAHALAWCGLGYVAYCALRYGSHPILTTDAPAQRNHIARWKTAAFYVPFIPGSAIFAPHVFNLALTLMMVMGLREYLSIIVLALRRKTEGTTLRTSYFSSLSPSKTSSESSSTATVSSSSPPSPAITRTSLRSSSPLSGNSSDESSLAPYDVAADFPQPYDNVGGHGREINVTSLFTLREHFLQVATVVIMDPLGLLPPRFTTPICYFTFLSLLIIHLLARRQVPLSQADFLLPMIQFFGFYWIVFSMSQHIWLSHYVFPDGQICSGGILAMMIMTSWVGDAAAYYVGKRYGTTKIMPFVSPGKTLQGCLAEVVFTVLLCLGFHSLQDAGYHQFNLPDLARWHYVAYGLIIGVTGVIGDLAASLVKRYGGVKDSGTLFPGHGGVLDRFDTFFFAAPFICLYSEAVLSPFP